MSQYSANNYTGSKNNSLTRAFDLIECGSIVLDVGCSSGNFGRALKELKKCTVDGIEIDKDDANLARKYLRKVLVGNIESDITGVSYSEYDYISFCDVIEHLVHPYETLVKIRKQIKKGGAILFSIPNMAHGSVRLNLLKGDFDYGKTGLLDDTHLHFYTKKSILELFEGAGYRVEKLQFTEIDYSDHILKSELSDLGLGITKKFKNIFAEETAVAYQYIGLAYPVGAKNSKLERSDIAPDPEYLYRKYYKEKEDLTEEKIRILKHEIQKLQKAQVETKSSITGKIKKMIGR